jgi:NADH-quinone oxidoreductase subunit H
VNPIQRAADVFITWAFDVEPSQYPYTTWVYVAAVFIVAVVLLAFLALFAGPVTWVERRMAGRIQSRVGPNRVGPAGFLQWLADGVKSFLKEDLIPEGADRPLFRMAPYLVFVGTFGTFVVLPFGAQLIAADLNVGLLYLLGVTSLVVVGLMMAGWASNSKWALFGGIRSAAQLVSYEIPSAFSLMAVVLEAGTLSTQGIIGNQGGWPWDWYVFRNPFLTVAFFTYFTAAIAEGNRTPFDLPEAESELVAGYNVEYSGMRFLFFFFAEWANLWVMSAIAVLGFLGGWQVPGVSLETIAASQGWTFVGWQALSFVLFAVKTSALVLLVIQLRWTLPRLRVDQLMIACWKYLVPISLTAALGTLVLLPLVETGSLADWVMRIVLVAAGAAALLLYILRIRATYVADRDKYRRMEGKELWYPPYRLP